MSWKIPSTVQKHLCASKLLSKTTQPSQSIRKTFLRLFLLTKFTLLTKKNCVLPKSLRKAFYFRPYFIKDDEIWPTYNKKEGRHRWLSSIWWALQECHRCRRPLFCIIVQTVMRIHFTLFKNNFIFNIDYTILYIVIFKIFTFCLFYAIFFIF